jgi:transcription elongation factor
VEVDLATGEGIINVPWFDLRKDVKVGDFIEIKGGSFRGQAGWVKVVEGPVVHIVEQLGL